MLYSLFVAQIVDEQFLSILTFIYLVIKYHDKTTIYIYIYIYMPYYHLLKKYFDYMLLSIYSVHYTGLQD